MTGQTMGETQQVDEEGGRDGRNINGKKKAGKRRKKGRGRE